MWPFGTCISYLPSLENRQEDRGRQASNSKDTLLKLGRCKVARGSRQSLNESVESLRGNGRRAALIEYTFARKAILSGGVLRAMDSTAGPRPTTLADDARRLVTYLGLAYGICTWHYIRFLGRQQGQAHLDQDRPESPGLDLRTISQFDFVQSQWSLPIQVAAWTYSTPVSLAERPATQRVVAFTLQILKWIPGALTIAVFVLTSPALLTYL